MAKSKSKAARIGERDAYEYMSEHPDQDDWAATVKAGHLGADEALINALGAEAAARALGVSAAYKRGLLTSAAERAFATYARAWKVTVAHALRTAAPPKSAQQLDAEIAESLGKRSHSTIKARHVALKPWPGSEIQSLLFDKQWSVPEAKDWARNHGYRHGKVDVTDNYIRLRQFAPIAGTEKRTITFGQGIKAIIEEVRK